MIPKSDQWPSFFGIFFSLGFFKIGITWSHRIQMNNEMLHEMKLERVRYTLHSRMAAEQNVESNVTLYLNNVWSIVRQETNTCNTLSCLRQTTFLEEIQLGFWFNVTEFMPRYSTKLKNVGVGLDYNQSGYKPKCYRRPKTPVIIVLNASHFANPIWLPPAATPNAARSKSAFHCTQQIGHYTYIAQGPPSNALRSTDTVTW